MIVGPIIKSATQLANKQTKKQAKNAVSFQETQNKVLRNLLSNCKQTEFGKDYNFESLYKSGNIENLYSKCVPIFQYDYMFKKYWHKTLKGVSDVSWPGRISNFALTSGTTKATSKRIPVSKDMIKSIRKTCMRQLSSINDLKLPVSFFEKEVLFIGGSTSLNNINDQYEGDLSGILTGKVPSWLNPFTKPSKKTRAISNWEEKLDKIVEEAPKWDVGIICGVPSWVQILINKIIDRYQLHSIFEIWPNIRFYIHGGVQFAPYINSFNNLFKDQVIYLDTYLASEGFFGYQSSTSSHLQLNINEGAYYEFIPFNQNHFDTDGNLREYNSALTISEIENNQTYALLITTNGGAFRYLIGDTIKFTNVDTLSFKITGRTKHYLSLCGEHLSVDHMTEAIASISYNENLKIDEFAVTSGISEDENYFHKWYIASNQPINSLRLKHAIDNKLCELNEDYRIERKFALKTLELEVLPTKVFYDFLKLIDKYGSQHKFPRVLKGKLADDWERYIAIVEEQKYHLVSK